MNKLKSEEVIAQVFSHVNRDFRGSLIFNANSASHWEFYFHRGLFSWATGGGNSHERLQRYLTLLCRRVSEAKLKEIAARHEPSREQSILIQLLLKNLIERQELAKLMVGCAVEVFFDLIQYSESIEVDLSYEIVTKDENYNLCLLLPVLEFETVFSQAKQTWQEWLKAGLANYSPNLYPVVKPGQLLEKKVSSDRERQIISLIDGKQTIRGIAFKSRLKTINLTRFLVPLVNLGAVEFSQTPVNKNNSEFTNKSHHNKSRSPLIACVDDSPIICRAMEQVLVQCSYRYVSIQDSMKVIPLLLKNKPDLIFLDLMMPVVNGYELCAQLRRVPSFKDVPIVILTGKDGLVDRMRAKLAGSTDFMSKPVEKQAVLDVIDKHLKTRS